MKIGLGSDHGGYKLKEQIKEHLDKLGFEIVDYGASDANSVDYPEYGEKVGRAVVNSECDKGILCCGTGIGISIAANKVKGVRCALCGDTYSARMAMEHNNSNILALGSRVVGTGLALEIVETWIKSEFQGGRHEKRISKIMEIERK